jgi:hypothetical protein
MIGYGEHGDVISGTECGKGILLAAVMCASRKVLWSVELDGI